MKLKIYVFAGKNNSIRTKNLHRLNLFTISTVSPNFLTNQMTQSVLMIAFILFCLNNVNGQKMYEKDPGFLASLGEEQVPLNGREYLNDKVKTDIINSCLMN